MSSTLISELNQIITNYLPAMLDDIKLWDSLIINRRKPFTYRVFANIGNYRICLHKFEACSQQEAFPHPHPWPGAFKILKGCYDMEVAASINREDSFAKVVANFRLAAGSFYEITNPLTWHSVIPREDTYTVMINGAPWPLDYAHKDIRTTKGKDLDKMTQEQLQEHLNIFKELINE